MKTEAIVVANLKCSGCANSVIKALKQLPSVQDVAVDVAQDTVTVSYQEESRPEIIQALHALGYPEATEKNGLLLQLKSYTSCMIGKMTK